MHIDRTGNAKRNIVFGVVNKVTVIILPFIVRTVMTIVIGIEYTGLSSLFTAIISVLSLAEMGLSNAIVYSMYKPIAENDFNTICALLSFYRKAYRYIGTVILVVGLLLMPFLPLLINGSYPADINLYLLYFVYLLNTVLSYFLFAYLTALVSAYQRDDIISKNNVIITFILNLSQIVVLLILHSYYVYVFLIPLFTVVNNIRIAIVSKKMFPNIRCSGVLSQQKLQDIKKRLHGLMISKLCITSRNAFDSIFISAFLGLSLTAIYNNYYYIMNAIISVLAIITTSITGGVGNSVVTENVEKNYKDMNKLNFLYMWLSGWCTICLLCLFQPFMKIWMGEALMLPTSAVILLCVYFYVLKMGDIRTVYVQVNGLWWENRFRSILEATGNLILNYILGKLWGIYGIIAATLLTLFFINFCYGSGILFKYYFKEQPIGEYFKFHIIYFIITTLLCALTYIICSFVNLGNWGTLIVRGIICCIVPNSIYVTIYRRSYIGQQSISWAKQIVKTN